MTNKIERPFNYPPKKIKKKQKKIKIKTPK